LKAFLFYTSFKAYICLCSARVVEW